MNQSDQALNIILVEDDGGHAELLQMNLKLQSQINEFTHFSEGQTLLDLLLTPSQLHGRYLIFLDINMPKLDGKEVLKKIKSNQRTQNIPVIILSTAENEKEIAQCYSLGCSLYLTKPTRYNEFSNLIRSISCLLTNAKVPVVGFE